MLIRTALAATTSAALLAGMSGTPAHADTYQPEHCLSSWQASAHTTGSGAGVSVRAHAQHIPATESISWRWRHQGASDWIPSGTLPTTGVAQSATLTLDRFTPGQVIELDIRCVTPTGTTAWYSDLPSRQPITVTALAASSAPRLKVTPFEGGLLASIDAPAEMGGATIVTRYHLTWWRNGYKVGEDFLDITDTDAVSYDGPSAAGDPKVDHLIDGLTLGVPYTVKVAAITIPEPIPTSDPIWRYRTENGPGWTKQGTATAVPLIPTVLRASSPSTVTALRATSVKAKMAQRSGRAIKGQKVVFTFDPDGRAKARKIATGRTNSKGKVAKRLRFSKSGELKITYRGTRKYEGRTATIRINVRGR